ncbi:hypothetical protein PL321_08480 [Caloramator sp. mosi_1]|uniref:hypothetical protein n=1 Tax=Caloramator sp. mosi_1 TaxID=3023090 RepID=UPI00235F730C|nr:hypothetical protein [Caloramator sp. mosi_1]WDC85382.1 hypothetical protein PL321_08480 [Caloramator sp. mosi_1]
MLDRTFTIEESDIMYRATKSAKIESLLLVMFGVSIGIIPLLSGKNIGVENILTSILVIILRIFMYKRVNRIRVIIHNDRVEYYGESKKAIELYTLTTYILWKL